VKPRRSRHNSRRGFTLLEALLSLSILVGSLAVIGELGRLGMTSARRASSLAVAQLYCESKLAELTSGMVAPAAVTNAPLEEDPAYVYSVIIEPTADLGLIAVRVTVAENVPPEMTGAEFTLVRWMSDSTQTGEETGDSTASDTASSAGSGASGSSSSGSGS
jgi:type II secretory pathway pseudopilin PulG